MEPYRPNCYKIPELNGPAGAGRVYRQLVPLFWQQSWLTPSIGSYSLDYLLRAGYICQWTERFCFLAFAISCPVPVPCCWERRYRTQNGFTSAHHAHCAQLLFCHAGAAAGRGAALAPSCYNSSDMVRDVVMHLTFTQTFNPATYIANPHRGFLDHCNECAGVFDLPLLARWAMKIPLAT